MSICEEWRRMLQKRISKDLQAPLPHAVAQYNRMKSVRIHGGLKKAIQKQFHGAV